MTNPIHNKWAAGVILFSLITATLYLLLPLFGIPVFGIAKSTEYIALLWRAQSYANMTSFLLPFIGAAGAIATVLFNDRGPHILSIAFSLLPLMFFCYFVIQLSSFVDVNMMAIEKITVFDIAGSGLWICLLSSAFTAAASIMVVVNDYKKLKEP